SYARTYKGEEKGEQDDEAQVNGRNGPGAGVHKARHVRDQRFHQVGKKNREQKKNQGVASQVDQGQPSQKEKGSEENPRRTCVGQGHCFTSEGGFSGARLPYPGPLSPCAPAYSYYPATEPSRRCRFSSSDGSD